MDPHAVLEVVQNLGLPAAAVVVLWVKLGRLEDQRSKEVDKYLDVIKENSGMLGEIKSALNRIEK